MPGARLIGLDWGSTQLRAFLMGDGGVLLDERRSEAGASRVGSGAAGFEAGLRVLVHDWLAAAPALPIVACGMVGSAHGWREAPYVPCPTGIDALHLQSVTVRTAEGWLVRIVPGVSLRGAGQLPDVMRGEETQLAGLLALQPALAGESCVLLPGTHSKWVALRGGSIQRFETHLTGELFALLREQSVLGRLMQPAAALQVPAFTRGVQAAQAQRGAALGRLLFSVRSLGLFGELQRVELADYLSGLLIGSEIASALPAVGAEVPLLLAGEAALCARYALALDLLGRPAAGTAAQAAAAGLWALASRAGWTGEAGPR